MISLSEEKRRRGFSAVRYLAPEGVWRIGYGTLAGDLITCSRQQAERWLREELRGE
jgi:GH24 family phage-related lysozyme (muramidase)